MNNEPARMLHKNFTTITLRRAKSAKKRWDRRSRPLFKMSFGMAAAVGAVLLGGVGTYAATQNWFTGTVDVRQNGSVITLDLTGCELPPGVHDPNRRAVKFKILGDKHVSQQDLQRAMTIECEFNAVSNFFLAQPASANVWAMAPSTITSIEGETMTFRYRNPANYAETKTRTIGVKDALVFEDRKLIPLSSLKTGDHALLGLTATTYPPQDVDIFGEQVENRHLTILRTQYDTAEAPSASKKNMYDEWNIVPLDWYEHGQH